jgi:hypothetical protein
MTANVFLLKCLQVFCFQVSIFHSSSISLSVQYIRVRTRGSRFIITHFYYVNNFEDQWRKGGFQTLNFSKRIREFRDV